MKKLVLTLAIVFAGIMSANAQVWVGGGLAAQVQKGMTDVKICPEIGYNITPQFTVALGAAYEMMNLKGLGNSNALYLQPYLRYVGGTIGKKFSVFLDLTADFGLLDASGYAVMLRPGVAWQATEKFTAAFRLGYAGYDHGIIDAANTNGAFVMDCALVAPEIRIYYTL